MKIAIVFDDAMDQGGAQRVINTLADHFADEYKYEVEIINYDKREHPDYFKYSSGVKITNLNIFKKKKNFILKYIEKKNGFGILKKYLKKNNYDIIIGIASEANIVLAGCMNGLKSKVIGTEHIYYDGHSLKSRLKKRLYYKKFDKIVVLTDYDYEKYSRYLNNLIKIHNPVSNVFKFKEYNKESKKILAGGRFSKQKGFDMLIKSMPAVIEKYPDWSLDILGEGSEEELLKELIKENSLEKNVILKPFSNEFQNVMDDYAFYTMSSRYEAFPCVLIEAQAKGLPIVSFDCKTGPNEIINHEQDGLLAEPENIEKLSEAIIKMIEYGERREEMSSNAIESSKRFLTESICTQWQLLFEELKKKG